MSITEVTPKAAERRQQILDAAYDVFGNYSFRRTSMDDIAKAAGISRPSLYQVFTSKNDIFSALVDRALEASLVEAEAYLRKNNPLKEQLKDLFEIMMLSHHRALESIPHGDEILGLSGDLVAGIFEEWERKKKEIFARALADSPSVQAELSSSLAQMISLSISGMKSRHLSVAEMEKEFANLVEIVAAIQSD